MSRTSATLVALILAGCSRPAPPAGPEIPPVIVVPPPATPDDGSIPAPRPVAARSPAAALTAGVSFLLAEQWADGSWRSDVYAAFKDGTALTPLAIVALQDAFEAGAQTPEVLNAITRGCHFLMGFVKPRGIDPGPDGFEYPVYTVSLTVRAFSHPTARDFSAACGPWVAYLKERQLTEKLGWKPDEQQYGGWGYCRVVPKKPEPNAFAPALLESNLSATVFALDALRVAKQLDPATAAAAAVFVRRCQNADGGFHFIYDDPVRNKAGGPKPGEFHSYGSTTADGLRALAYCQQQADAARRIQAGDWLTANFRPDTHPGKYVAAHERNREAVYFYYAASAARVLREFKLELPSGRDWSAELAAELAGRQWRDGHWENRVELVRENDPLVATCNAVSALSLCKLAKP